MSTNSLDVVITAAITSYKGDARVLEAAIGALLLGQHIGLRPLRLIHGGSVVRKYQNILGVEFRDVMPDDGPLAHKSVGYGIAQKIGDYWASVRGHAPGHTPQLSA